MEMRIALTLSQLLVPLLIAFIIGVAMGVGLVRSVSSGIYSQPPVVVERGDGSGLGWLVVLIVGVVAVLLFIVIKTA